MERPLYINWLVNEEGVTFEDGVALKCYKLSYECFLLGIHTVRKVCGGYQPATAGF